MDIPCAATHALRRLTAKANIRMIVDIILCQHIVNPHGCLTAEHDTAMCMAYIVIEDMRVRYDASLVCSRYSTRASLEYDGIVAAVEV